MIGTKLSITVRLIISIGLLVFAWVVIGGAETLARFAHVKTEWVILAVALSVPQIIISAQRWRFTAARLGAQLGAKDSIAEYYVSTFVNQVVPGGVTGDVLRAWRHVRRTPEHGVPWGRIARAVFFERAAGQVVLLIVMAAGIATWPAAIGTAPPSWLVPAIGILGGVTILVIAIGRVVHRLRSKGGETAVGRFVADAKAALLSPRVLPAQLGMSSLIVASYLITYWCCGKALGTDIPIITVITVVPAVLMAMLLPVSIAGWGLREMAAAALWPLAGMSAADGIAIATLYGLVVLAGSLPGAIFVRRSGKVELEQNVLAHGDRSTGRP
ncbi:MAG: lysylphosphatidylglycerol synthase transmembrane domain-containing protein [Pseudomonadota bacterium]